MELILGPAISVWKLVLSGVHLLGTSRFIPLAMAFSLSISGAIVGISYAQTLGKEDQG